eukprot:4593531-Pyramimonas_sp.AAC.2
MCDRGQQCHRFYVHTNVARAVITPESLRLKGRRVFGTLPLTTWVENRWCHSSRSKDAAAARVSTLRNIILVPRC